MKRINLVGSTFGRLTVVSLSGYHNGQARWLCRCECGNERINGSANLRNGRVVSCGCFSRERIGIAATRHGYFGTPTYNSWAGMKGRCNNPRNHKYPDYGGRGISVCERWMKSFENFLKDMGEKPFGKTIDRINNNGNYEPANCRWSTPKQQVDNRRPSKTIARFAINGFFGSIPEIADRHFVSKSWLSQKVHREGKAIEQALSECIAKRRVHMRKKMEAATP